MPYEDLEVQDQIWTIGLPDELLELTPMISPKLSPLSQLTIVEREIALIDEWVEETDNVLVSAIWGWVKEPITQLVKVTKETINLVVTLGEAILSGNPGEAMQALQDIGNFLWRGIVSFAQNPMEFYVKVTAIFIGLALCALIIWVEVQKAIVDAVVAGFTWFINFIKGLAELAIKYIFKPMIDFIKLFLNELAEGFNDLIEASESEDPPMEENFAKLLMTLNTKGVIIFYSLVAIALALEVILTLVMGTGIGAVVIPAITTILASIVMTVLAAAMPTLTESIIGFIKDQTLSCGLAFTSWVLASFGFLIAMFSVGGQITKPNGDVVAAGPPSAIAWAVLSLIFAGVGWWITLSNVHPAVPVIFGLVALFFGLWSVKRAFSPDRPSFALGDFSKGFSVGAAVFASAKLIRSIGIYLDS